MLLCELWTKMRESYVHQSVKHELKTNGNVWISTRK